MRCAPARPLPRPATARGYDSAMLSDSRPPVPAPGWRMLLRMTRPGFLLLTAAYGAVLWKLRGTTIGGIVCNLQIVRSDGRPMPRSNWLSSGVRCNFCGWRKRFILRDLLMWIYAKRRVSFIGSSLA